MARERAKGGRRRWAKRGLFFALGVVGGGGVLGCCVFSGPRYTGEPSDHFDGARFVNQAPTEHAGSAAFFKWMATRSPGAWTRVIDAKPGPAPPKKVPMGQGRVTWIGHATALLQLDGVNVLTDPIWSERCSPVNGVGPRRFHAPGLSFEDLPPIHAVVVSHNHYDHLDMPTLRRLHQAHRPRFFVGLGNGALLEGAGIESVTELDWWQSTTVSGVRVHMVPAQHFSGRGLCDRDATLWGGYVLQGKTHNLYFAGDTGFGPHFAEIARRFAPIDLALLPIGAYLPRWFMSRVHTSPAEAVQAHQVLRARRSVAIHFDTFALGDDGQGQARLDLGAALASAGVAREHFWVLGFGEGRDLGR